MTYSVVRAILAAALVAALPAAAAAQFPPPPPPPGAPAPTVRDRWPDPPKPPQTERAKPPAQQAAPKREAAPAKRPAAGAAAKPAPPKRTSRAATNTIACSGVFAKSSSHLKLAVKFDSRNIVYSQVEGSDGSKLNATILFPNDPKRRLEVLWENEAARSDISVIAINGKSQWIAPKGLKLGMTVAALEKLNGRPFKLTGFGKDGSASVADWDGGALSVLPGGCKVGIRLLADLKTPDAARNAVAGDKELLSNSPSVRAVRPAVGEILIGY